jgi:hypothetical protein
MDAKVFFRHFHFLSMNYFYICLPHKKIPHDWKDTCSRGR